MLIFSMIIEMLEQIRIVFVKKIYFFNEKGLQLHEKYNILFKQRKNVGSIAKLVRLQTATLSSSVRVRLEPPSYAQVAKLVDAQDLKSCGP